MVEARRSAEPVGQLLQRELGVTPSHQLWIVLSVTMA
jgi:hypothetical protein